MSRGPLFNFMIAHGLLLFPIRSSTIRFDVHNEEYPNHNRTLRKPPNSQITYLLETLKDIDDNDGRNKDRNNWEYTHVFSRIIGNIPQEEDASLSEQTSEHG